MTSELDELDKELADLEKDEPDNAVPKKGAAKTLPIIVAAFALLSFGGIVFYSYHQGVRSGSEEAAPLLTPEGLAKIQPDDPGGLEVPHQDKLVFNRVEPERDDSKVERLLPPPEDPMQPPVQEELAESANKVPPIPSIIETPDPNKKATVPPLPAPQLQAPTTPPPTATVKPTLTPPTPVVEAPAAKVEATVAKVEPVATKSNLAKSWRIQIGAVKSDAAAKAEWAKQQKANEGLLGKLSLEVQKIDVSGKTYYRVRGGPLKNKTTAKALCDKLKAKKVACIIVKPDA